MLWNKYILIKMRTNPKNPTWWKSQKSQIQILVSSRFTNLKYCSKWSRFLREACGSVNSRHLRTHLNWNWLKSFLPRQSHSHLLNDKQMGYIIEIIEFQYYFASKDLNRQVCNLMMIECSIIHSDGCFRCQHDFFSLEQVGSQKGCRKKD